jgi:hypothetical protein
LKGTTFEGLEDVIVIRMEQVNVKSGATTDEVC